MKKIVISDVALKACAAQNGGYFTFREKLNIAKYLVGVKADAIELPQIVKEREDSIIYKTVVGAAGNVCVKIDCGVTDRSAQLAADVLSAAQNGCLQIVLPVSTVQMEYSYHKKSAAMLAFIVERVAFAKTLCDNVEFVAADASRADKEFLVSAVKTAAEAGATSITLCDDACVWLPDDGAAVVSAVAAAVKLPVLVKASDKIGVGIAVVAACIAAGASGAVTSALDGETISLASFADFLAAKGEDLGVFSAIDHTAIHHNAEIVQKKHVSAVKEGGQSVKIRITAESSLSDVSAAVASLGYDISEADAGKVFEESRRILNRKTVIEARELEAIIATAAMQAPSTYHLESYVVNCGNVINATAQITLSSDGEKLFGVGAGDGPIDAAFKVIEQIIGHHYELDDFQIQTVTEGRESVGHALVKLREEGRLYSGNGVSTDIVGASVRAYLNALNKIIFEGK